MTKSEEEEAAMVLIERKSARERRGEWRDSGEGELRWGTRERRGCWRHIGKGRKCKWQHKAEAMESASFYMNQSKIHTIDNKLRNLRKGHGRAKASKARNYQWMQSGEHVLSNVLIDHLAELKSKVEENFVDVQRRQKVKEAMLHAWTSNEKYAWGQDELRVGLLYRIFNQCGTPLEDYWKKLKPPTSFRPPQPYKPSLIEAFRDFPASSLGLLTTLLALDRHCRFCPPK
ncbi:hypothetical protein Syun_014554 [Stephania yunnanensis]|uniref:Uncharacterized protein n=1 Tax=Stephania yunnanensis TaxID=152371 RepID=A0AAP0JJW0_9MAGN